MSKLALIVLVFLVYLACVYAGKDYYKILGIKRDADETQIRRAFKKLSLKYHPDKNKDNPEKAKAKFVEVANAYEVLSDPQKRKVYDMHGEEGVNQESARQAQNEANQHMFNNMGMNANMNFDDIFKQFFGGGGGDAGAGGGGFHFNFGTGGAQGGGFNQKQQLEDYFKDSDVINISMGNLSTFYRRKYVWVVFFYMLIKLLNFNIFIY